MLIAISKFTKPLDEIVVHRPQHMEYIKPLIAADKLLITGKQNPWVGGVMIAGVKTSREEFEKILANEPLAKLGLAEYQIIEFTPVFYADAVKFLFEG
jgi:uncharacterized protein YciI